MDEWLHEPLSEVEYGPDWTKWLICQMGQVWLKLADVSCQLTAFLSECDELTAHAGVSGESPSQAPANLSLKPVQSVLLF